MGLSVKVGNFIIDTSKTSGQTQSVSGVGFQPKIVIFWWGGTTSTSDTVTGQNIRAGWGAANGTTHFSSSVFALDGATDSDDSCHQYTVRLIQIYSAAGTVDGYFNACSMGSDGFTLTVSDQYSLAQRITFLALGGTDITNTYISNVTTTGTTGNYNITGVGFQPDVVLIGGYASSVNNTNSTGMPLFLGMATASGEQGVVSTYSLDAQATSDARGYGYNGEIISSRGGGERDAFVSFISDGVTLNHISGSSARVVYLVAIKGGQWHVGEFTTRTDTNNITESGVGFQPLAAFFASANRAHSTQGTYSDHARLSIGATDGTTQEVQAISNEDNLSDTECAVSVNDGYVYQHIKDDAQEAAATFSSFSSDGFTLTQSDAETGACWVTYLAVAANAATSASSNKSAYIKGQSSSTSNKPAYIKGSSSTTSNKPAYTKGSTSATSNKSAYVKGRATSTSNKSAYIKGSSTASSNKPAYTKGRATISANKPAYISGTSGGGGTDISSSKPVFTIGIGDILVPDTDQGSVGDWRNQAESASDLYQSIDEAHPSSDTDFIYNVNPTDGDYYECTLTNPSGIVGSGDVVVFWRGWDFTNSGHIRATIQLRQGTSTVIASMQQTLTSVPRTYFFTLTAGERSSITDWTDLRIRILPTQI